MMDKLGLQPFSPLWGRGGRERSKFLVTLGLSGGPAPILKHPGPPRSASLERKSAVTQEIPRDVRAVSGTQGRDQVSIDYVTLSRPQKMAAGEPLLPDPGPQDSLEHPVPQGLPRLVPDRLRPPGMNPWGLEDTQASSRAAGWGGSEALLSLPQVPRGFWP